MKSLDHENVVRNLTNFEDSTNIYLLMELAEEEHLYSRLKKAKFFNE
jgi:serine/threonine protein kinase